MKMFEPLENWVVENLMVSCLVMAGDYAVINWYLKSTKPRYHCDWCQQRHCVLLKKSTVPWCFLPVQMVVPFLTKTSLVVGR